MTGTAYTFVRSNNVTTGYWPDGPATCVVGATAVLGSITVSMPVGTDPEPWYQFTRSGTTVTIWARAFPCWSSLETVALVMNRHSLVVGGYAPSWAERGYHVVQLSHNDPVQSGQNLVMCTSASVVATVSASTLAGVYDSPDVPVNIGGAYNSTQGLMG